MSALIPKSPKTGGEILLYQTEDGRTRIQCRLEDETLWLTQAQIAELFQTTPQNVTLHLKAIFAEEELAEKATCKDYLQVRHEGKRAVTRRLRHYRLETILAVGYRVRSHRGTQFRQWATARLGEYLVKECRKSVQRGRTSCGWARLRTDSLQRRLGVRRKCPLHGTRRCREPRVRGHDLQERRRLRLRPLRERHLCGQPRNLRWTRTPECRPRTTEREPGPRWQAEQAL